MFGSGPFSSRPFSSLQGGASYGGVKVSFLAEMDVTITLIYRIYAATREFATEPDDSLLPSQPFVGSLKQPLSFTRSILGSDIIGRFTAGSGEIDIDNVEGSYDYLIQGYAVDGRDVVVQVGEVGADTSTFVTIFRGPAADW